MSSENDALDDKYDLALQTKTKNKIKLRQASEDPTYQLWDQQNQSKFGFIPLGPLFLECINTEYTESTGRLIVCRGILF